MIKADVQSSARRVGAAVLSGWLAAMVSVTASPSVAEEARPFAVTKLCGISGAPEGFQKKDGFFTSLSPYYETPYEIYENAENTAILISNMKDGCWVQVDSKEGAWKVSPIVPVGYEIDFKESKSRRFAEDMLRKEFSTCGDSADPDAYAASYYFFEYFRKSSIYSEIPKEDCSECPSICYYPITYGTASIRLDQTSHIIIADLVVGTAIVGEVK